MKILDISFRYNPHFQNQNTFLVFRERYLGYLSELSKNGHEVLMVHCGNWGGEFSEAGIRHFIFRKKPSLFWLPGRLLFRFRNEKLDMILVHGLVSPVQVLFLKMGFSIFNLLNFNNLKPKTKISSPKIYCIHHAEKPATHLKSLLQKLADRLAVDGYFFASLGNSKLWLDRKIIFSEKKVAEVMEISTHFQPKNKLEARQKLNLPAEKTILIWVGRLHFLKDPMTVLKGFQLFLEKESREKNEAALPHFYFIFQKDELLGEVKNLLERSGILKKQVHLLGKIDHPDLENWFSAADFFVSGSRYEGSGTALAEAMACGCVPVVSDISAFKSITENGAVGWLFETGNPEDFAKKLSQAIENQSDKFREKIILHFKKHLSWQAIARKMVEIGGRNLFRHKL